MPASFVDEQVQFVATASALAGGPGGRRLQRGRPAGLLPAAQRRSSTRRASRRPCTPARRPRPGARRPRWPPGRRSRRWRRQATQRRPAAVRDVAGHRRASCRRAPTSRRLATGEALGAHRRQRELHPLADHVADADGLCRGEGGRGRRWCRRRERRRRRGPSRRPSGSASVTVDPRYGVWVPVRRRVFTPFAPEPSDVLNASANEPGRRRPRPRPRPARRPSSG